MSIIIAIVMAAAPIGSHIDRASLDLQAQVESLRPSGTGTRHAAPQVRLNDLRTIASICEAASRQREPGEFLAILEQAYSLSALEAAALRNSCTGYLAGRASVVRASIRR
jgi:hypothetical protein